MQVRNCDQCGKLFLNTGGTLCPACAAEEDRQFEAVREHLSGNPGSSLEDTHRATGVAKERILKFLRQGRLMLASAAGELSCERCGRPIALGSVCPTCADELRRQLQEAQAAARRALKELQAGRMHIAEWLQGRRKG
ncbi:MAG: hypothetical protein K6T75_09035 [Acetobacteraceae bacterium]|nr:hypothetical protein [Acetobacteraceae bacterium]